jgi:pyridoxal phosphate enzyme (YggS family)
LNPEFYNQKLKSIEKKLRDTQLLIVSKTRSVDEIKAYYELGHFDFGENRVQELEQKAQELKDECPKIRWHMIGHLQSNKVNQLFQVPNLYAIHSVHDQNLVEKLVKAESKLIKPLHLFLQYNTSKEEAKSGFETYAELRTAAELVKASTLKLAGLMTMGTLRTDDAEAEAKRCFHELNELKERLESEMNVKLETSMGMSQDYEIALAEKSNWIRLGTMMFS